MNWILLLFTGLFVMAAMSNYLEDAITGWINGTTFPAAPANLYVAVYTTATDDGTGGTEVTGGSYARAVVAAGGWTRGTGGAGTATNTAAITFPTATADWGTISHVAIMDAASGGNRIMHGALAASRVVPNGATLEFAATELDLAFA